MDVNERKLYQDGFTDEFVLLMEEPQDWGMILITPSDDNTYLNKINYTKYDMWGNSKQVLIVIQGGAEDPYKNFDLVFNYMRELNINTDWEITEKKFPMEVYQKIVRKLINKEKKEKKNNR